MTSKGSVKEGRGESSRSSHSGKGQSSRANAAAAEPLFPRVHVSETTNGPKAPPRNKMALYEQLTVPSQHFLQRQASGSVWPPMNPAYAAQYVPFAGNCFTPCFVPPGLSYHHDARTATQSTGPHLGSMVMDSDVDKEIQRVPRAGERNSSGAAAAAPPAFSASPRSVPRSSSQQHASAHTVSTAVAATATNNNNNASSNSNREVTNKRVRNEDDFAVPTYCFPKDGGGIVEDGGGRQQEQEQQRQSENASKDGERSGKAAPPQVVERTVPSQAGRSTGGGVAPLQQQHMVISPRDRHKGHHPEQICSSNICESGAASDNKSEEMFLSLHEEQVSGDVDSNASIVDSVVKIAAKDVVGAVGEKEFWKTRKTLLRQQRIFATQVFELHRVVKVQHLLADSPKLLLEPEHPREQAQRPRNTNEVATTEPDKRREIHLARPAIAAPPPLTHSNKERDTVIASTQVSKAIYSPGIKLKDQRLNQRSYPAAAATPPIPATIVTTPTPLNNSCSSSPAPAPAPGNGSSATYTPAAVGTFPGQRSSWGYATFPGSSINQWTMIPPSACPPYVFQAPPGYNAAYQPVFHGAPGGSYEIYSMVPRPGQATEMPSMYWQQPMFPAMPPNVSSGWYAFPPQFYDPSAQTQPPPKLPKSANSTVMSPLDHQQQQLQLQEQQHNAAISKFPGSTHNSDKSSIAQSSEYHQFQHPHQEQQRGGHDMTQRWIEGEQQQQQQPCFSNSGMNVNYSMPFTYAPPSERQQQHEQRQQHQQGGGAGMNTNHGAMKVVPRAVMATPESAAGILKSIQRERR